MEINHITMVQPNRERKLTKTLFVVIVVFLLLTVPFIMFWIPSFLSHPNPPNSTWFVLIISRVLFYYLVPTRSSIQFFLSIFFFTFKILMSFCVCMKPHYRSTYEKKNGDVQKDNNAKDLSTFRWQRLWQ